MIPDASKCKDTQINRMTNSNLCSFPGAIFEAFCVLHVLNKNNNNNKQTKHTKKTNNPDSTTWLSGCG